MSDRRLLKMLLFGVDNLGLSDKNLGNKKCLLNKKSQQQKHLIS